ALPAVRGRNGEVEHVQLVLVQLVDHEPDDAVVRLGDHADAVPLPEAFQEIVLGPGELEAVPLGPEDVGHVTADHPPDGGFRGRGRAHGPSCAHAAPSPVPGRGRNRVPPVRSRPGGLRGSSARAGLYHRRVSRTTPSPAAAPPSEGRWPLPGYSL